MIAAADMKADANAMLDALNTDDWSRAAHASAATLGGVVGWGIREGLIEPGKVQEVFDLLVEVAHEFARAEAMAS